MTETASQVKTIFTFVETVLQLLLAKGVSKGSQVSELAHRVSIKLIDTGKCLLTDSLLVVSQQQASELLPLEKVFAMVLSFGHRQHILVGIRVIVSWLVELET